MTKFNTFYPPDQLSALTLIEVLPTIRLFMPLLVGHVFCSNATTHFCCDRCVIRGNVTTFRSKVNSQHCHSPSQMTGNAAIIPKPFPPLELCLNLPVVLLQPCCKLSRKKCHAKKKKICTRKAMNHYSHPVQVIEWGYE